MHWNKNHNIAAHISFSLRSLYKSMSPLSIVVLLVLAVVVAPVIVFVVVGVAGVCVTVVVAVGSRY